MVCWCRAARSRPPPFFPLFCSTRYDCIVQRLSFGDFWRQACEADWQVRFCRVSSAPVPHPTTAPPQNAYTCFEYGVYTFMVVLGQIGWIIFSQYDAVTRTTSATIVSVVAGLVFVRWFGVSAKWCVSRVPARRAGSLAHTPRASSARRSNFVKKADTRALESPRAHGAHDWPDEDGEDALQPPPPPRRGVEGGDNGVDV